MKLVKYNSSVVISISLILFLIGILGIFIINAKNYSDYLKEKIVIELFFKKVDNENEVQNHLKILNSIRLLPYVLKAKYIDQETASSIAKKDLGLDSYLLFEENIFPPSIEVLLHSEFMNPDNIQLIKNFFLKFKNVEEVKNDYQLIYELYENISKISFWIIGFSIFFIIISIILISNSIQLKIYSKRFIVKTMQLVGAKRRFILYSFLKEAFFLALFGTIISLLCLFSIYVHFMNYINHPINWIQISFIFGFVFLIGILITCGSTVCATWKIFHIKQDELY